MSLYSKYRPQNFANLVGQDHIRMTLLHEIQKGTLTHAYLFAGPRGTGKTSTARLIAKALNCTNKSEEGEPCDTCDMCKTIRSGALIDVIEIDAASNRGIDEIRDLREKIKFAPTRAKTKVYIIDEIHMLTKEAFNALLKTLEEPPENVYFILCTTEIHKIPETIVSRCQRFDFKRIDLKTIMTRLNFIAQTEGIEAEDTAIELIARHVEGGMRDAIGLMEQMTIDNKISVDHVRGHLGITGHQTIKTLIDLLVKKELAKAIHLINEVHNEGYDLTSFVREILETLRENLINEIQQGKPANKNILLMIEKFEEARDMLRFTIIPQLPLEIAVIKICGGQVKESEALIENATQTIEQKDKKQEAEIKAEIKIESDEETSAAAQKEEEATAKTLKKEYDMEVYQGDAGKNWPRVLEHVQPPSLRRSLATATSISETKEGGLKLVFGSKFHMEKVNLSENKAKIEKAIEQVSGKKMRVECELNLGISEPVRKELPSAAPAPEAKPKTRKKNAIEEAMEIFGNE